MKHVAIAALLLALIPMHAAALDTTELLGLVAMPLAVAAASEVTGVPAGELSNLVATLNRAAVPPTQVVQVIRYAPVALVVEREEPTFVQFVDTEVGRGVTGTQLVTSIDQRLRTYDIAPDFVALPEPATTFVLSDDYIPPVVVTRVTQLRTGTAPVISGTNDLLALIAMPLAVSAVAEVAGVPLDDLSRLVAELNGAGVAPVHVVEVLRYAPVALMADDGIEFVQFVDTQAANGLTGVRLVEAIEQQLRTYDVTPEIALRRAPTVTVVDQDFIPTVIRTRIAEVRRHPHGGPPGQIKKTIGVQTGAEVVHGEHPSGRAASRGQRVKEPKNKRVVQREERRTVVRVPDAGRGGPPAPAAPGQRKKVERAKPNPAPQAGPPPGRGQGHGSAHGQGKGKGKGKG